MSITMNEENTKVEASANLDWLEKYPTVANDIMCLLNDQFDSIKKRLIDKNKNELSNSVDAQFFAKSVAKSFVQSVSSSMENLIELKLGIIKEFRNRHPLLGDDWLSQESQTICSLSKLNGFAEDLEPHVDLSAPVPIPNVNSRADIEQDPKWEPIENKKNQTDVGKDELKLVEDLGNDENGVVVIEAERQNHLVEITTKGGTKSEVEDSKPVTIVQDTEVMDTDEQKASQNSQSQAVNLISEIKENGNCDKSSAPAENKLEEKNKPVVDDQIPGPSRLCHLSTKRLARVKRREFEKVPSPDSSDTDFDVHVPLAKRTRKATTIAAVTKSKVTPKPKSKQQQPTPKSKQQQPQTQSKQQSEAKQEEPQSKSKSKQQPLTQTKQQSEEPQPVSTRRGPLSRTRRRNDKAEETKEVKSNTNNCEGKADSGAGATVAVDKNYWKTHNFKEDTKLKNTCVVVVKKSAKD